MLEELCLLFIMNYLGVDRLRHQGLLIVNRGLGELIEDLIANLSSALAFLRRHRFNHLHIELLSVLSLQARLFFLLFELVHSEQVHAACHLEQISSIY